MYYKLSMDMIKGNTFVKEVSHEGILLTAGKKIDSEIPLPFKFIMEVSDSYEQFDPDYDGPPTPKEPNLFAYYSNACLMLHTLVDALHTAGVENIQTFPATVEIPENGKQIDHYVVVNVIGMISCANLEASESDPLGTSHFFHKLVIDPARTNDFLLFRLAEYPPNIIVHEKVAIEIRKGSFNGLILEPVVFSRRNDEGSA